MKKDELVHLHSLLAVLRAEYEQRGVASPSTFAAYDELDLSPLAVYGSKEEHARAVRALASALASVAEESTASEESPGRSTALTSPR